MANITVPTSKDIYIEVNGRRLAVVESYKSTAAKESRLVEAFGSTEPVASLGGKVQYVIDLSRVCVLADTSGSITDFYALTDFNLVIVKPDCKIVYSGCQWASITEQAELSRPVIEQVRLIAARRMVMN